MARIYYRSSLFLYEVIEVEGESPIIRFWRATVYTFWRPAKKESLREILQDYAQNELTEPKEYEAWEEEQVEPSESRGLGFYWVDISKADTQPNFTPESRVAIVHLPTWEKANIRLGYSEYFKELAAYVALKRGWETARRSLVKFGEWLTYRR